MGHMKKELLVIKKILNCLKKKFELFKKEI